MCTDIWKTSCGLSTPPAQVKVVWQSPRRPRPDGAPPQTVEVDSPAVVGAVWRDVDDARKAVFAANLSDAEQTVRFRMPPGCGRAAPLRLPGQPPPGFAADGGVVTLAIAPRAIVGVVAASDCGKVH